MCPRSHESKKKLTIPPGRLRQTVIPYTDASNYGVADDEKTCNTRSVSVRRSNESYLDLPKMKCRRALRAVCMPRSCMYGSNRTRGAEQKKERRVSSWVELSSIGLRLWWEGEVRPIIGTFHNRVNGVVFPQGASTTVLSNRTWDATSKDVYMRSLGFHSSLKLGPGLRASSSGLGSTTPTACDFLICAAQEAF